MKLPRDIGPIHFVGIGGIGMSGIAEVLCNLGYTVTGSDVADSANVKRLRDKGIKVAIGHAAPNIGGADVIVVSSAIRRDNPELIAARAQAPAGGAARGNAGRIDAAQERVAIGGTHGKTTTTSLVATLLDAGGFDPTVINGGIIEAYGTNARLGAGDWMVVEADESDGTFLKLPADIAIVTNVDPEHLDHFKTFEAVQQAFRSFVENVPFYGFARDVHRSSGGAAACRPHRGPPHHHLRRKPAGRCAAGRSRPRRRRVALHCVFRDRAGETAHEIAGLTLPMPGRHNALNATAAIAVAHELGIADDDHPQGARRLWRRAAALHPHRRVEWRCRSSTITAITRSRSPPCCGPRVNRPRAR